MRNNLFSIAVGAILFASASLSHAASPLETLTAFHAALSAGDSAKAIALMAPDVTIYESGYVERSRAEYASHHLAGDIEFAKTVSRKVLKHTERIHGQVAMIYQETETTGTARGKPVHLFGTETTVMEKQGDTWAIVHVHWSSRKAK
jgi:ketosteroid isomerase-like protein